MFPDSVKLRSSISPTDGKFKPLFVVVFNKGVGGMKRHDDFIFLKNFENHKLHVMHVHHTCSSGTSGTI